VEAKKYWPDVKREGNANPQKGEKKAGLATDDIRAERRSGGRQG
jgi:hypothetical protein